MYITSQIIANPEGGTAWLAGDESLPVTGYFVGGASKPLVLGDPLEYIPDARFEIDGAIMIPRARNRTAAATACSGATPRTVRPVPDKSTSKWRVSSRPDSTTSNESDGRAPEPAATTATRFREDVRSPRRGDERSGMVNPKRLPPPWFRVTQTRPPCHSTKVRTR